MRKHAKGKDAIDQNAIERPKSMERPSGAPHAPAPRASEPFGRAVDRASHEIPIARNVILLVAFLLLTAIGVVTVLVPALSEAEPDANGPKSSRRETRAPAGNAM